MGKYSSIAWGCFCFGLISIASCYRTYNNRRIDRGPYYGHSRPRPHYNRRQSHYERSIVNHRPQMQNSEYLEEKGGEWSSKGELLISGVLVEDIDEDELADYENVQKRQAPERGFYQETQKMLLDLHNLYRSNVTPPASNMRHMEWDDDLAYFAQLWADDCVFEHGTPPNTEYSRGAYGQNLYLGHDPTGENALYLWYAEFRHYNIKTFYCKPYEQCGHYVQMAWGDTDRLGCGIRKCDRWLIVCHYHGPVYKYRQMYSIGQPCSNCPGERGSLCRNNLCFSWEQCARLPHLCAEAHCNLHCHNCGRLDSASCKCDCADGYDSTDCSRPCVNEHKMCGQNPGFPDESTCSIDKYVVAKVHCRKMCGECNGVVPAGGYSAKGTCCDGKVCADGSVLDFKCNCTLLCPGEKCGATPGPSLEIHEIPEIPRRVVVTTAFNVSGGLRMQNRALHLFIFILMYVLRHNT